MILTTRPVLQPPSKLHSLTRPFTHQPLLNQHISQQHKRNILHNIQVLVCMWLDSHCSCLVLSFCHIFTKFWCSSTLCVYCPSNPICTSTLTYKRPLIYSSFSIARGHQVVVISHYVPLPQLIPLQQPQHGLPVSVWTARIWLWWTCPHAFWDTLCVARTETLATFLTRRTACWARTGVIYSCSVTVKSVCDICATNGFAISAESGTRCKTACPSRWHQDLVVHPPHMYSNGSKQPSMINGQTHRLTHAWVTTGWYWHQSTSFSLTQSVL